jgi:hypothetical protein
MVRSVTTVELVEYFSETHLEDVIQKPYLLLNTEVQDPVDSLCQVPLDVWLQSHLEGVEERGVEGRLGRGSTNQDVSDRSGQAAQ